MQKKVENKNIVIPFVIQVFGLNTIQNVCMQEKQIDCVSSAVDDRGGGVRADIPA